MRFFTPERKTKRYARRLRNALRQHSRELPYTRCLDLVARLYGFAHFSELKYLILDMSFTPHDEDVDDETLEARFQYQEHVMAEAGFADIAGALLDEINPTGRGNGPTILNEEVDEHPD